MMQYQGPPPYPVMGSVSPDAGGGFLFTLGSIFNPSSTTWPAANRAIFVPFTLYEPATIAIMWHSNGVASGNLDLGIYSIDGTRIISKGSTASSGLNTNQILDITDTPLAAGKYYMACAFDNTTATSYAYAGTTRQSLMKLTGIYQMDSAFPLPATATFATFTGTTIPQFGIATRTFV